MSIRTRVNKPVGFDWSELSEQEINDRLYEVELSPVYYYPNGYNPYNQPIKNDNIMLVVDKKTNNVVCRNIGSIEYRNKQSF